MKCLITMNIDLHEVSIIGKRRIGKDVIEIMLDNPNLRFKAGQYIRVIIDSIEDPRERSRCFNLISSPDDDTLRFAFIRSSSIFKQTLLKLDKVKIKGPYGRFTLPSKGSLACIAIGIGITPFLSMLSYATKHDTDHRFDILYKPHKHAYMDELLKLKDSNSKIRFYGDVNARNLDMILNNEQFYISGYPSSVSIIKRYIMSKVPNAIIKTEEFTGYDA